MKSTDTRRRLITRVLPSVPGLRLIPWRGAPSEDILHRWRSRAHVRHRRVSTHLHLGLLVKVRVQIMHAMAPVEVDRQDLQDRGALRLKRRVEGGAGPYAPHVVVQPAGGCGD